jgi:hypothetical protein
MFVSTDNEFIVTAASRIASRELRMNPTRLVQIGMAGSACAVMLFAGDFWKTKDSTLWTDDEVSKILSDSPWAKAKTVQPQQSQARQPGMGRRGGGFGYPGGGGIGFPGGGGGYPRSGGGYPRSGGGGGYPSSTGNSGDPSQNESMNLTIRWESAVPIQQAFTRQGASAADELKAVTGSTEKYYVIQVLGLHMPRPRRSSTVDADDQDDNRNGGNDSDDNNQRRGRNQNNDALRSQLLDAAQLAPKGKSSIYAQDVQIEGPGGIDGVRFLFPRSNPISAGDKEVDFILDFRRIKVEEKFKLGDMQYEGKLAL